MRTDRTFRIDEVAEPRVGVLYLVPAVFEKGYLDEPRWWPVLGPLHEDAKLFNFKDLHYHYDQRFMTREMLRPFPLPHGAHGAKTRLHFSLAAPLQGEHKAYGERAPMSAPELKLFRCIRTTIDYPYGHNERIINVNTMYFDVQADRTDIGWLCPHRRVLLNFPPNASGVITCPLHGLRINAKTGRGAGAQPIDEDTHHADH